MAPIRYSLHYEDYSDHLMSRFGKLLQMQSFVDMTLMCSSHTLRVHKVVLSASSAYFQEVLQKQTGEPLIILKMRFSVLKCLIEFMYCGKTQCLEENLDELVSAAQFLKIKGLSKVTKEGLGINTQTELPVFTPPVVISRPPKSLLEAQAVDVSWPDSGRPTVPPVRPNRADLHISVHVDTQDNENKKPPPTPPTTQSNEHGVRTNKDSVVRIPFDVDVNGGDAPTGLDFTGVSRVRPRRGRPSARRGWETTGVLGRAAERALLRREQDSRKAIHQLKHLQSRQMQDYMDRVTLSQAVNSICGPESSSPNYMNLDTDLLYMDQTVSSNILDPNVTFSKENETITSSYHQTSDGNTNNSTGPPSNGISAAMSQYVNALKNAGLPTDLPILFESGDGSYINVNEQVLLDMVQSNEIQYEVIEQPNIIEKVSDPTEIKSIDELSKSIERGEMLMNSKNYPSTSNYDKESNEFMGHEEAINSLNAILPDNLESFSEQQNYVVLDNTMQENGNSMMNNVNNPDFSSIVNDMQFFTKSMSDEMKNYYEDHHSASRTVEQMCPTSTGLDTNFNMSFLDTKVSHLEPDNLSQDFNSLNTEDLRRNDSYDFSLQLGQNSDFKDDALDCLMSAPKTLDGNFDKDKPYNESEQLELVASLQEPSENIDHMTNSGTYIIDDDTYNEITHKDKEPQTQSNIVDFAGTSSQLDDIDTEFDCIKNMCENNKNCDEGLCGITSRIRWHHGIADKDDINTPAPDNEFSDKMDLHSQVIKIREILEKHNNSSCEEESEVNINNDDNMTSTLQENIPYAVGLLPMGSTNEAKCDGHFKRPYGCDVPDNYLKRKIKQKKV